MRSRSESLSDLQRQQPGSLVDISGRSDVPPSTLPEGKTAASDVSALQKITTPTLEAVYLRPTGRTLTPPSVGVTPPPAREIVSGVSRKVFGSLRRESQIETIIHKGLEKVEPKEKALVDISGRTASRKEVSSIVPTQKGGLAASRKVSSPNMLMILIATFIKFSFFSKITASISLRVFYLIFR